MLKNLREVVVQKWLYLKINIGRMPIEISLLISTTYIFHDHRFRPRSKKRKKLYLIEILQESDERKQN
jgi:hypothetical protein